MDKEDKKSYDFWVKMMWIAIIIGLPSLLIVIDLVNLGYEYSVQYWMCLYISVISLIVFVLGHIRCTVLDDNYNPHC